MPISHRSFILRLGWTAVALSILAIGSGTSTRAATPPNSTVLCPTYRPASPNVDPAYPASLNKLTHMVVIPMQIVYDTCKVASILATPPPGMTPLPAETATITLERMRTIALEAHYLGTCPHQQPTEDPNPTYQDDSDVRQYGCGPYPYVAPQVDPTLPPALPFNPCTSIGATRPPYAGPMVAKAPEFFTTHPPVGRNQAIYDLCIAAYELSEASMSANDPNVIASNLDSAGVPWEQRFATLYQEVHYVFDCANGRSAAPPDETDPDFAANRDFGCGPYL